ncbi:MAG: rhomboid family intramembrane serine protease [Pirellulaceae bacterium]
MRLIGHLDSKTHAERFSAFLMTHGISSHCEQEDGRWELWIRDEDQIDKATKHLEEFRNSPDAAEYRAAVDEAHRIARQQEKKLQEVRANQMQMNERWNAPITKAAPLTIAMIVICVIVSLITNFGDSISGDTFQALSLASLTQQQAVDLVGTEGLDRFNTRLRMGSLTGGEVWRAITPAFIHFGVFHLLFNMYWLVVFGRQVESRYGALWMAILVALIAIPSNISGALVPEHLDGIPIENLGNHWSIIMGGMSGVIYGLFGYVWMKMVFDPKSGMFVSPITIAVLLIWMLICMAPDFTEMTGMNVANWAHGMGLVVGLMIGYLPKLLSDLGMRRSDTEG